MRHRSEHATSDQSALRAIMGPLKTTLKRWLFGALLLESRGSAICGRPALRRCVSPVNRVVLNADRVTVVVAAAALGETNAFFWRCVGNWQLQSLLLAGWVEAYGYGVMWLWEKKKKNCAFTAATG